MDKSTEKFDLYINKTKLGIGYYYNSELYFPLRSTASINSCNVDWNSMENSINLDYNWLDLYHKVKINAVCFTSFVNNNYFCIVYDDIDKPEKSMLIFKSTAHSTFGDLTDNYEYYDRFDVLIKGLFNEFENIDNLTINIDFNKITDKKLISLTDKEYSELNALIDNVNESVCANDDSVVKYYYSIALPYHHLEIIRDSDDYNSYIKYYIGEEPSQEYINLKTYIENLTGSQMRFYNYYTYKGF